MTITRILFILQISVSVFCLDIETVISKIPLGMISQESPVNFNATDEYIIVMINSTQEYDKKINKFVVNVKGNGIYLVLSEKAEIINSVMDLMDSESGSLEIDKWIVNGKEIYIMAYKMQNEIFKEIKNSFQK